MNKLTKQQRKNLALKEYQKIRNPAWKEYLKKYKKIDSEDKKVCKECRRVLE